jgi:multidrug efflux pump
MNKASKNANKEYRLASWAIDNPTIIYVLIALFFTVGLASYFAMPREEFPEVIETKIYVSTVYPGNTAEDIERLVIDPLEDRIKNISNVTKLTSTSQEDYGMIMVEFEESVTIAEAKVRVQNEVDVEKASEDWPVFNGAKVEPNVFDLNIAESQPIMNVNLKGD